MGKEPMYIGLSGLAGTGKDSFYQVLKSALNKRLIKVKRYSLGDCLKEDVKDWCIEKYSIDPTNCNRKEKNFIRPLLVAHAGIMRSKSDGRYWIELLKKKIQNDKNKGIDLIVITDIRYHEYERDEVFWLKKELSGILVHLRRYYIEYNTSGIPSTKYLTPLNEDEKKNDPALMSSSDVKLDIYDVGDEQKEIEAELNEKVQEFLGWISHNDEEDGWNKILKND